MSKFKVILLTYPKVIQDSSSSKKEDQRSPMTGTIDKVGGDIKRIKDMGVEHIIFGYSSLPKGNDVNNMIDITKQLSKFCS